MTRHTHWAVGCLAATSWIACTQAGMTEVGEVGLDSQALTVCEETVPADRNVDGIPAYAQCAESNDSAIYSNNGVDTSTTQMGSDWVSYAVERGLSVHRARAPLPLFQVAGKVDPERQCGLLVRHAATGEQRARPNNDTSARRHHGACAGFVRRRRVHRPRQCHRRSER